MDRSVSKATTNLMLQVNNDVLYERCQQNKKWGHQRHDNGKWLAILGEEFGEVAQAMQKDWGWGKPTDKGNLYEELMHVAAVASAWAEQIKEEHYNTSQKSESLKSTSQFKLKDMIKNFDEIECKLSEIPIENEVIDGAMWISGENNPFASVGEEAPLQIKIDKHYTKEE